MNIKQLPCALVFAALTTLLPIRLTADELVAKTNEVKIDNFNFTPQTLTVPIGTQVTWVNKDDIPHTVTSGEKLFKSRALDTDDKFSFTFQKPGTNGYYCSMHPKMTGQIIVR